MLVAALEMALTYQMEEDDKPMEREGKLCSHINCSKQWPPVGSEKHKHFHNSNI